MNKPCSKSVVGFTPKKYCTIKRNLYTITKYYCQTLITFGHIFVNFNRQLLSMYQNDVSLQKFTVHCRDKLNKNRNKQLKVQMLEMEKMERTCNDVMNTVPLSNFLLSILLQLFFFPFFQL